ncbi:MAG: type II toxin-antitoxin system HicA family toxin, partial [Bacteroidetes bacterium]|nr:type II toxin-antitoxin system HicA family toxin [Bacteroidota bacterium]
MSKKLVPISGRRLCKLLENQGFEKIFGKGSHIRYKHPDGRRTVVPVHSNEDVSVSLLTEILKQVEISKEVYEKL